MTDTNRLNTLRDMLKSLVDFAYERGYHEDGFDVLAEFETALRNGPDDEAWLAKVRASCEKSRLFRMFLKNNFWTAHHADIIWRHNGQDVREEADWLCDIFYAVRRHTPGQMPPPESMPPGTAPTDPSSSSATNCETPK